MKGWTGEIAQKTASKHKDYSMMVPAHSPIPDTPVSFGYKCAWYAVRTREPPAVAAALNLKDLAPFSWDQGIKAAYVDKVFVTPALGEWTLAAGKYFFCENDLPLSTLTKLSLQFGEAQYFCTHRVVEAHFWAIARRGALIRAFGYVGDCGKVIWNEGNPTPVETEASHQAQKFPGPTEEQVMQIAGAWSIDPTALEVNFTEPGLGWLGTPS